MGTNQFKVMAEQSSALELLKNNQFGLTVQIKRMSMRVEKTSGSLVNQVYLIEPTNPTAMYLPLPTYAALPSECESTLEYSLKVLRDPQGFKRYGE